MSRGQSDTLPPLKTKETRTRFSDGEPKTRGKDESGTEDIGNEAGPSHKRSGQRHRQPDDPKNSDGNKRKEQKEGKRKKTSQKHRENTDPEVGRSGELELVGGAGKADSDKEGKENNPDVDFERIRRTRRTHKKKRQDDSGARISSRVQKSNLSEEHTSGSGRDRNFPGETSDIRGKQHQQTTFANASIYTYHEETGLLTTDAGGGDATNPRNRSTYLELPNSHFIRVDCDKKRRKLFWFLCRKEPKEGQSWHAQNLDDNNGNIVFLRNIVDRFQSFAAFVSLCAQGLLGGLGLTNLLMTYFANVNLSAVDFLRYYSPMAMVLNRYYYVMVSFALVAAINKYARNLTLNWDSFGRRQRVFDGVLILLYFTAYVCSVIITPFDDLLTYNAMRIPDFYRMKLTDEFRQKLAIWHVLSFVRMGSVLAAWLLVRAPSPPFPTSFSGCRVPRQS
uniref:Uncharacterized protein n=1 Tax=Tetraselmis sp. GSL018 TaxID=582737 RepID=A0A061RAZ9_9CHLO|eukprot:CAMPEP_0177594976 /NCGR_PEP_ID=MMETSP0419_2-20121207/10089_1 /TAXON_ID=582737 /ORGANISM="Tetraselmis sp., Strain GSL018" /LENGTH=448 /DNA_ID=CAMNT_0019086363 /DNA_START=69 /DNA_END=1415 /DNA_ORIENTATION=+